MLKNCLCWNDEKHYQIFNNLECLGIDWKINEINKIAEFLEKLGATKNKNLETTNVKSFILSVLKRSKNNDIIQTKDLDIVLTNLEECDHHDLVRVDNIITRIQNGKDGEYSWGSVTRNLKWRK